jgi:hypothetical protein
MTHFVPIGQVMSMLGITGNAISQLERRDDCPADMIDSSGLYNVEVVRQFLETTKGEPSMTEKKRRGRPPKNREGGTKQSRKRRTKTPAAVVGMKTSQIVIEESPEEAFRSFVRGFWETDSNAVNYLSESDKDWTMYLVDAALQYGWENQQ